MFLPFGVSARVCPTRDLRGQLISRVGVRQPEPLSPLGSVGVGLVPCVTLSMVSATGGAELTSLALMARVTRSVSSLMVMSVVCDRVGKALMWHSTAP